MRYDQHTPALLLSAVVAAVLARLAFARQPSPAPSPLPCVIRPNETVGFQPIAGARNAMMPPVLPPGC